MKGILITGGSGGIGSALVRLLRHSGHEVWFTYRNRGERALQLQSETGACSLHYDCNQKESLDSLSASIRTGSLDGLVNLAADRVRRESFLKMDAELCIAEIGSGIRGTLRLSQAFAASCREQKRPGSIINILTSYLLCPPPEKMPGYIMLKHALLGLTRAMAVELARHGIRVNAVSPSMTRTEYLSDLPERFITITEEGLPLGRLASAEEVAGTIAFLLSPAAAYIHGANVPVAGGTVC